MSRSASRYFRNPSLPKFSRRPGSAWPLLIFIGLVLTAGGCRTTGVPVKAPVQVEDRFLFRIYNQSLQPLPKAVIRVSMEAGQNLVPLPLVTDVNGSAVLRVKAQESSLVAGVEAGDRLIKYRSTITYRVDSPGRLPGWGRAELTDSFEKFSRPSFSAVLNAEPKDKSLPIRHVLYRVEDFFEKEALKDPLARTMASGLDRLWRTWSFTGRINRLKPTLFSWAVDRRPEGPYLKVGFDLENALDYLSDSAVHLAFETELIPVLDDLAALYGPFAAGWEITFNLAYRPAGDPHAMPVIKALRLVFSEELRTGLLARSGGLNWLIPNAEFCTLAGKPWRPHETLAKEDARHDYIWRVMPVFFVPGRGQTDKTAEIKDTSEAPLPVSPGPF